VSGVLDLLEQQRETLYKIMQGAAGQRTQKAQIQQLIKIDEPFPEHAQINIIANPTINQISGDVIQALKILDDLKVRLMGESAGQYAFLMDCFREGKKWPKLKDELQRTYQDIAKAHSHTIGEAAVRIGVSRTSFVECVKRIEHKKGPDENTGAS
jgi:hypothetical protein